MADGDALEAVGRSAQTKAAYQNDFQAPEPAPVFQEFVRKSPSWNSRSVWVFQ